MTNLIPFYDQHDSSSPPHQFSRKGKLITQIVTSGWTVFRLQAEQR